MPGRKRLAYGDGEGVEARRPKLIRTLVFGSAFFAAMTACTPCTNAVPIREPAVERPRRAPPATESAGHAESPGAPSCRFSGRTLEYSTNDTVMRLVNLLDSGESVREVICRRDRAFVLTDTSRIIVRPGSGNQLPDGDGTAISHLASYTRTDMAGLNSRGIVDWEATDSACYFLTRDRRLTVLANDELGDTVPEYELPFDTAGLGRNRMAFHSGFIFIAPLSGSAVVMSFGENAGASYLPLESADRRAGFIVRGDRLFFGKNGKEKEIIIGGPDAHDVSVR
ncbi:MAG: hypothetical protein AB1529_02990 [Candidatus Micrarchaeota archaeon]